MLQIIIAQDKVAAAQDAIKENNYNAALSIAKELLDEGSTNAAQKLLIQLNALGIHDNKLYEYLGDSYEKMGVDELALSNYKQVEENDSLNVSIKFKIAELFYRQQRYTDAVNKYLKIISIDKQNSKAYLDAAQILYLAKYYADAATMYEKYIAIEQSRDAYERITYAFLETGNYEKTYQYAIDGLKKYSGDSVLEKNGAIAAFVLRKFDEAVKYYSSVPDSMMTANDFVNAARSFQQLKSDSAAFKYFEKAYNRDSTFSGIYMDLANYNYLNKNYDVAAKFYKAKTGTDSTYEPAYRFLAFALMQQQKYEDARKAFIKAISLNDTLVASRYWLAQTYRKLDSLNSATKEYREMLDVIGIHETKYKNEYADAYGFLGQSAFEKKDYKDASVYLKKSIAVKNDILAYKIMLASSLHQNGNTDEAVFWYRKVLAMDPNNEIAKKGLRMLSAD